SAQAARPIGRPSARTVKPGKIKIDAPANEIGAQVLASLELFADRTTEGPSGRTILLDSDTVRRFAVLSQRSARNPRGQLQVQIAVLCKKGSDLEYRVLFLDEVGQPVSATGVLSAEFETGQRKRFTITAGDARAASYVCLLRED
ncbi:MAG: hypothetical protein HZB38_11680, partial [Planctomycetes bacterium]|nr:hypothetical protein [Planctomycetota bacterium]